MPVSTTQFVEAARNGNIDTIAEYIVGGGNINTPNGEGTTALMAASTSRQAMHIVRYLLRRGADVNAVNSDGSSALSNASSTNLAAMEALINAGADVNLGAPMHTAAFSGNVDGMHLLINNGADVNDTNVRFGHTPLHEAILNYGGNEGGNMAIIRLLVENGADLNARNINGYTPLMQAAYSGNGDIVRLLIDHGADVHADNDSFTAMHAASSNGNVEAMQLLIDNGADVHTLTRDGDTNLHLAARREGGVDAMRLLIDNGVNVNAENTALETALHQAARSYNPQAVTLLIDNGARINAVNENGETALHSAAASIDVSNTYIGYEILGRIPHNNAVIDAMEVLIANGADLSLRNRDGQTAIQVLRASMEKLPYHERASWDERIRNAVQRSIETARTDDQREAGERNMLALGDAPGGATNVALTGQSGQSIASASTGEDLTLLVANANGRQPSRPALAQALAVALNPATVEIASTIPALGNNNGMAV